MLNLSAPFIKRPIATSLLMLLLLLLGAAAYFRLPIAALPQMDIPTIQVSASLPGASPEVMSSTVTSPLERQLSLIAGVTELTSTSSLGSSNITLQFDLTRNIDAAAQDVSAALNAASGLLPSTLPHPPSYEKSNPADFQIMTLAVRSPSMPLHEMDYYADAYIARQLSRIPGVGLIDLHGEQAPAVRVELNPVKLAALGLSLEQVRAALGTTTVSAPKGTLDGPEHSTMVDTTDQLRHAAAFEQVILAWHNGAPVRVRDVGYAVEGPEDVKRAAWYGGDRAIIVDIHKAPGANVVETIDNIRRALPALEASLPATVTVDVASDRTQTIRASVTDTQYTLLLAVILVVLVVYAFLRGVWATLIPAVTIPLSILGTFAVMDALGYTLNNLTLMGLTIAVGFVVDDAIVVIENIIRHREAGDTALEAALKGAREIGFTVVSMTISLIAAFIPLLFMGGLVGRLFHEFAVTITVALLVSAVVSLTLTPMMCRILLDRDQPHPDPAASTPQAGSQKAKWNIGTALLAHYERTLDWALDRQRLMLAVTFATLALTVLLYWYVPKGFFPQQDTGMLVGATEAPSDISAPLMATRQQQLVEILRQDADVATVFSWIGESASANTGRIIVTLKPFSERHETAQQIMQRLKDATKSIEGIKLRLQARQDLQIGGRSSRTQFQYTLQDSDSAELYAWVPKLLTRLKDVKEIQDVNSDMEQSAPGSLISIDRERAGAFGITPQAIDNTLYDALGQRQVATLYSDIEQYHVVMEVDPEHRLDPSSLEQIYLPSSDGHQIPLSVFSSRNAQAVPLLINHQDQFPAVTISFNLADGVALGDAVNAVNRALSDMQLPVTLHGSFQGSAKAFQASLANQPWLIAAALLAVYIVLGILYESYIHPITIISTLPSAGLGALLALQLFNLDLSLLGMIGIILLIGIVKKNAIMMIDFALVAEREGLSPKAAIRQACLLRFRPIMMTSLTAILGGLPLALGSGAGAELRFPLGVATVGGLLISQLLTLYTTPIIYLYMGRLIKRPLQALG